MEGGASEGVRAAVEVLADLTRVEASQTPGPTRDHHSDEHWHRRGCWPAVFVADRSRREGPVSVSRRSSQARPWARTRFRSASSARATSTPWSSSRLRAWAPVFDSVREVLGELFLRLHPDWRASQAASVRSKLHERGAGRLRGRRRPKPRRIRRRCAECLPRTHGPHRHRRRRPRLSAARDQFSAHGIRDRAHAALWQWISRWSKPAGTLVTHLRGRHMRPRASRCSRSPDIFGCSGDIRAHWPRRRFRDFRFDLPKWRYQSRAHDIRGAER